VFAERKPPCAGLRTRKKTYFVTRRWAAHGAPGPNHFPQNPQATGIAQSGFRSNCYNPRIFLVVDCIMGFEQLAALKEQLAKQAAEKRAAKQAKHAKYAKPQKQATEPRQASEAKPASQASEAKQASEPRRTSESRQARQAKAGRSAPGANRGAPAQKSKPVDPVVLTIGKLQKRFPKAFPKNPAPKVPLKVGIFKDLLVHAEELGLTEAALRDAIKVWCWGSRYWACVVDNAMRVDLSGEDAGQVLPAEAARARGLQAKRQKSKNAAQAGAAQQDANASQQGEQNKPVAQGGNEANDAEQSHAAAQDSNEDSRAQQDNAVTQDSSAEQGDSLQ
jgi:ProP effector